MAGQVVSPYEWKQLEAQEKTEGYRRQFYSTEDGMGWCVCLVYKNPDWFLFDPEWHFNLALKDVFMGFHPKGFDREILC